jgi:hypothetical protein
MSTPNKQNPDGSLAMPDMNPASTHDENDEDENRSAADYPADVANDIGQASGETTIEDLTAQNDGDVPRIDDLGIDDLQDQPHKADVDKLTANVREDRPLFDRSVEDTADFAGAAGESDEDDGKDENEERLPEEDELGEEESRVYDISLDGPGTSDLH